MMGVLTLLKCVSRKEFIRGLYTDDRSLEYWNHEFVKNRESKQQKHAKGNFH